jgi:UDP-glucose 4-epimerase
MEMKILLLGHGYIGSYLLNELKKQGIDCTCLSQSPDPNNKDLIIENYKDLTSYYLSQFSHVLWFAGHSSVSQSMQDPIGAVSNNVTNLYDLGKKIGRETKLIYASSASIYSGLAERQFAKIEDGVLASQNIYDASKKAFDLIVTSLPIESVGLRMGTVCGVSPKTRTELIFNAMNISAIEQGVVNVSNSKNQRTLLFLSDLKATILQLLEPDSKEYENKFYNAGSTNLSIGQIGKRIANYYNVPLIDHGQDGAYSFNMEIPIEQEYQDVIIENQCAKFEMEYAQ